MGEWRVEELKSVENDLGSNLVGLYWKCSVTPGMTVEYALVMRDISGKVSLTSR